MATHLEGFGALEAIPKGLARRVPLLARRRDRRAARMLRDEIISNAEQVMEFHTMGYRDSWEVDGASVGSDHPAVYRLEFGFVGIDSMGRHVSQAPREHIRTAIITVSERHFRGAGMVFEEGLRSVRT